MAVPQAALSAAPTPHGALPSAFASKFTLVAEPAVAHMPVDVTLFGTLMTTMSCAAHPVQAVNLVMFATVVSEIVICKSSVLAKPELTGIQSDTHKTPVEPSEYGRSFVLVTLLTFTVPSACTSTLSCAGETDALRPMCVMMRLA